MYSSSVRARRSDNPTQPSQSSSYEYNKTDKPRGSRPRITFFVGLYVLIWAGLIFWAFASVSYYGQTLDFPSEMSFELADTKQAPFGSLLDAPTVSLSVIVPAYSEEKRLPVMLDDMLSVLDGLSQKAASKW